MNYPAVPKKFGTSYQISPLPRGEGMKGRVSKIIIYKYNTPIPTLTLPPQWGGNFLGTPKLSFEEFFDKKTTVHMSQLVKIN